MMLRGTGDHGFWAKATSSHSHRQDGSQSDRSRAGTQFYTLKPSGHLLRYYYFSLIKWGIAGNYTVGPFMLFGADG